MAFESLARKERKLVEIVNEHVWDSLEAIEHVPWGYETHISQEIRDMLARFSVEDDLTARYIRHSPDFFIVQQTPDVLYLVDYKCTTVPVWSPNIIREVSRNAGRSVEWPDIGVMHTASYDNYVALQSIGAKVAILTYIAYHERLLLCDFIENIDELRRAPVRETEKGSGKDVINFDASQMKTLEEFLEAIHGIGSNSIAPQIQLACAELRRLFPIEHDWRSPYAPQRRR